MKKSDFQEHAINAMIAINAAIQNLRLYPASSTSTINSIDLAYRCILKVLEQENPLVFAEAERNLLIGEVLLGMHLHVHTHEHASFAEQAHIGFIEAWQIVIPAAIAGILIAYFRPKTKFPHAGHVLLSTWASSFHMLMAMDGQFTILRFTGSFLFLFLAVWLPCCVSDIAFPLLFVKNDEYIPHHH